MVYFLAERLPHEAKVFEFGSGYSTIFFSEKAKSVTSLEYDEEWFFRMEKIVPTNVELLFERKEDSCRYSGAISQANKAFDFVVIDGRHRVQCFKESVKCLSDVGCILLDDTHRARYYEAFEFASKRGFRSLNFFGYKATSANVYKSTLFYRDNNLFGV